MHKTFFMLFSKTLAKINHKKIIKSIFSAFFCENRNMTNCCTNGSRIYDDTPVGLMGEVFESLAI